MNTRRSWRNQDKLWRDLGREGAPPAQAPRDPVEVAEAALARAKEARLSPRTIRQLEQDAQRAKMKRASRKNPTVRGIPDNYKGDRFQWARESAGLPPGEGSPASPAWRRHADLVKKALTKKGIRVGRQIGCGSMGCAFEVVGHPDQVLKITGDQSEAAAAAKVMRARKSGKLFPPVVRFLAVFGVPGTKLTAILQERLKPLSFLEKRLIAKKSDEIYAAGFEADGGDAVASSLAWRYLVPKRKIKSIALVAPGLEKIGVDWRDLHDENVMRDAQTKEMKVLDLGVSRGGPVKIPSLPKPNPKAKKRNPSKPLFPVGSLVYDKFHKWTAEVLKAERLQDGPWSYDAYVLKSLSPNAWSTTVTHGGDRYHQDGHWLSLVPAKALRQPEHQRIRGGNRSSR